MVRTVRPMASSGPLASLPARSRAPHVRRKDGAVVSVTARRPPARRAVWSLPAAAQRPTAAVLFAFLLLAFAQQSAENAAYRSTACAVLVMLAHASPFDVWGVSTRGQDSNLRSLDYEPSGDSRTPPPRDDRRCALRRMPPGSGITFTPHARRTSGCWRRATPMIRGRVLRSPALCESHFVILKIRRSQVVGLMVNGPRSASLDDTPRRFRPVPRTAPDRRETHTSCPHVTCQARSARSFTA